MVVFSILFYSLFWGALFCIVLTLFFKFGFFNLFVLIIIYLALVLFLLYCLLWWCLV